MLETSSKHISFLAFCFISLENFWTHHNLLQERYKFFNLHASVYFHKNYKWTFRSCQKHLGTQFFSLMTKIINIFFLISWRKKSLKVKIIEKKAFLLSLFTEDIMKEKKARRQKLIFSLHYVTIRKKGKKLNEKWEKSFSFPCVKTFKERKNN